MIRLINVIAIFLVAFALGRLSSPAWPQRLETYGRKLRVGAPMPGYTGVSRDGRPVGPAIPAGQFHVHLAGAESVFHCLDLECTPAAIDIVRQGGHVQTHDFKIGEAFGIPRVHDGVSFALADRLLIITSGDGAILAIFRNAGLENLELVEGVLAGRPRIVDYLDRGLAKLAALARSERPMLEVIGLD